MRTAALMAVLMVAGCSAQAVQDPEAPAASAASASVASTTMAKLDGTEWRFVEVGGTAVPPGVKPTMRLRRGRFSGRAGCNNYGGSFEVAADGTASFSQTLSTKMACLSPPGAMQVEQRIFALLRHVSRVELRDRELTLLDAEGKPLARLEPAGQS